MTETGGQRYNPYPEITAEYYFNHTDWKQQYHIELPAILLNRPKGFIYNKGIYHLFYHRCGNDSSDGALYHITSTDLVTFSSEEPVKKCDVLSELMKCNSRDEQTIEEQRVEFNDLDYGFDFIAPQITIGPDKERILMGWMRLSKNAYVYDNEKQADCLTVARVLSVENGQLRQRPHPALEKMRGTVETAEGYAMKHDIKLHPYEGQCYELIVDVIENESTEFYIELRVSKKEATRMTYNQVTKCFSLDLFDSSIYNENMDDYSRSVILDHDLNKLQIFVDKSSIEIFLNNGEKVMTSRIFPQADATGIRTSTESGQVYFKFTKYDLSK